MKVCKFCGTENYNHVAACSSCGGNEFKYKCDNCGTVYEEGKYCPKCGVKSGAKAKKCPICGAEYYSVACPDCGYSPAQNQKSNNDNNSQSANISANPQPVKKRKTWLWVLGWILIFPAPLTVLMLNNQKLDKWVRYLIIALSWIVYILIGLSGQ